jgi:hypothetical protein
LLIRLDLRFNVVFENVAGVEEAKEELEEIINRYNLLANQDWKPIIEDYSDSDLDDTPYPGGRLFF